MAPHSTISDQNSSVLIIKQSVILTRTPFRNTKVTKNSTPLWRYTVFYTSRGTNKKRLVSITPYSLQCGARHIGVIFWNKHCLQSTLVCEPKRIRILRVPSRSSCLAIADPDTSQPHLTLVPPMKRLHLGCFSLTTLYFMCPTNGFTLSIL